MAFPIKAFLGMCGICLFAFSGYWFLQRSGEETPLKKISTLFASGDNDLSLQEDQGGRRRLPVPRFVSLKSERVNVRRGPSAKNPVLWIYTAQNLPVEIIGEYEQWRHIRDSEGAEGWVYHSMLSGKRTAMLAPWHGAQRSALRASAQKTARMIAYIEPGAWGKILSCNGQWCSMAFSSVQGWVEQSLLFGVYPNEVWTP